MFAVQKISAVPIGVMSFTLPTANTLCLGNKANAITPMTVPTTVLAAAPNTGAASAGALSDADGAACFLKSGIPQRADGLAFAQKGIGGGSAGSFGDVNGHNIKHAIVKIISGVGVAVPSARYNVGMPVGTRPPDATHGSRVSIGDVIEIWNSADAIFNFQLYNNSGASMEIDVEVYE